MRRMIIGMMLGALAALPVHAAQVEILEVFQDWSAVQHTDGKTATCFATSRPTEIAPKAEGVVEAFAYLSYYPVEKVEAEISFKLSYPPKKGVALSVAIGADVFKFVARDDRAFMDNPKAQAKLIAALQKGDTLLLKGTPAKGTATAVETYSLKGLSEAMARAKAACAAG